MQVLLRMELKPKIKEKISYNRSMNKNQGVQNENCIFCKIAKKEIPAEIIWENEDFMAFLDIFPVVPGATVVIPKKHYDSYIKNASGEVTNALMEAVKKVMEILDKKLEGNVQTKLIFEGMEVSHLHAKLWPTYSEIREKIPDKQATPEELKEIANKIRS